MVRLTRGERFKDARIVHNQHKKQTMDEVSAATGISKSLIQSLEDDSVNRSVGYDKVAKLAAHYHVTIDFLLGLSDNPFPMKNAVDELGLSPDVVEWLKMLNQEDNGHGVVNDILANPAFQLLVDSLCNYYNSKIAEIIYDQIYAKYFSNNDEIKASSEQIEEFYNAVGLDETRTLFDFSVTEYLYAQRALWDRADNPYPLAAAMTRGEGFTVSEIAEYKATKYLADIFDCIGYSATERFKKVVAQNGND